MSKCKRTEISITIFYDFDDTWRYWTTDHLDEIPNKYLLEVFYS